MTASELLELGKNLQEQGLNDTERIWREKYPHLKRFDIVMALSFQSKLIEAAKIEIRADRLSKKNAYQLAHIHQKEQPVYLQWALLESDEIFKQRVSQYK